MANMISRFLLAAAVVAAPVAVSATTVFNITDNAGGQVLASENVDDGEKFTQSLTTDDSVSINVNWDTSGSIGAIGFTFLPSPLNADLSIALSTPDFGLFGAIDIYLSTSTAIGDAFASATASPAGVYDFFGITVLSPLYVIFDWENDVDGSFNADLMLSAVPVPAAGFLLLGALGGLGVIRRRRRKAA